MGCQQSFLVHHGTLLFPLYLNDLSDWNAVLNQASLQKLLLNKIFCSSLQSKYSRWKMLCKREDGGQGQTKNWLLILTIAQAIAAHSFNNFKIFVAIAFE